MTYNGIYISRLCAWAPGIETPGEWDEWAQGRRDISFDSKGPELAFTEPMFRRRLSQISKMTVQVIHDLLSPRDEARIFFLSFRGELSRQYQINKMLIEENELMPAAFSLSVFNAPAALAAIALGLKGGYSALYPAGKNPFAAGLDAAAAALLHKAASHPQGGAEIAFVYADEQPPPEYEAVSQGSPPPAAFGLLLSTRQHGGELRPFSVPLSSFSADAAPLAFLRKLLLSGNIHVSA